MIIKAIKAVTAMTTIAINAHKNIIKIPSPKTIVTPAITP